MNNQIRSEILEVLTNVDDSFPDNRDFLCKSLAEVCAKEKLIVDQVLSLIRLQSKFNSWSLAQLSARDNASI